MSLIDNTVIQSWLRKDIDPAYEAEMDRCCAAAVDWVEAQTGRILDAASKTAYLDGDDAGGARRDILYLPSAWRPVTHSGSTAMTVVQNATTLSLGIGYSTTVDVQIDGANEDRPCRLVRRQGVPWLGGLQNITVTATVGYTAATLPADIAQLIAELALLFFRTPDWLGKVSVSKSGASASIVNELSEASKATLAGMYL